MKESVHHSKPVLMVFPFGLLSHYLRCLVLARYFRPYFEIVFLHHPEYVPYVEQESFSTFHCLDHNAAAILALVNTFNFSWLNEKALEPVYLEQVMAIERLKPAAVLGDTSPTLKMAAEKTGVAYISLMNGYMSRHYAHIRRMSQTHPMYKYLSYLPVRMFDLITKAGETVSFYQVHKPFKKIRNKHALSVKYSYLDELEGDINLVCDLAELFPQKKLPDNYSIIAPLYYDAHTLSGREKIAVDKTKKTIFVSMGSSGDWNKVAFLNDACFRQYNIITAGDKNGVLQGDHLIKKDFLNIHDIFPFTDLVICHGGNGTLYQALYYSLPVLCKTSHFEQEWNVHALEKLEAGRSINDVSGVEEHLAVIEAWMNKYAKKDDSYKDKIRAQKAALQQTAEEVALKILSPALQHNRMIG